MAEHDHRLAGLKELLAAGAWAAKELRTLVEDGQVSPEHLAVLDEPVRNACTATGYLLSSVMIAGAPAPSEPEWRDPETGRTAWELYSAD